MNHVERFRAVMDFQPVDRLPRWEWAMWWDQTINRWKGEGLPARIGLRLRHLPVLRPRPVPAVLVLDDRPDDRGRPASHRGDRLEHGRLPAAAAHAFAGPRPGDRGDGSLGRAPGPRRSRRLDHPGGLFLVPPDADGLLESQPGLLRSAGAPAPDQRGPDRFQPGHPGAGRQNVRPDIRHDRRGHVLQPRADDLAAALRRIPGPLLPAARAPPAGARNRPSSWTPTAT